MDGLDTISILPFEIFNILLTPLLIYMMYISWATVSEFASNFCFAKFIYDFVVVYSLRCYFRIPARNASILRNLSILGDTFCLK